MFKGRTLRDTSFTPIVHLVINGEWKAVNIYTALNKYGPHLRQPSVFGRRPLEAENWKCINTMANQFWPIRDSFLAKAHRTSGNKIFFLNSHDPSCAAYYLPHDDCKVLAPLKGVAKKGDCIFHKDYIQLAQAQLLRPLATPTRGRNTFIHELSHWLDHTLDTIDLKKSCAKNKHLEIQFYSGTRHAEQPLFRFLTYANNALSNDQDTYAQLYSSGPTKSSPSPNLAQRIGETFAEVSNRYYSLDDCSSIPLITLYFSKILEFQLQVMFIRQSMGQDLSPLADLADIISLHPQTLFETYTTRDNNKSFNKLLDKAEKKDKVADPAKIERRLHKAATIVAEVFDNIIAEVKSRHPSLTDDTILGSAAGQRRILEMQLATLGHIL